MLIDSTLLNEAIPLYIGVGLHPFPFPKSERLHARYGDAKGRQIEQAVTAIISDLDAIQPDWTKHTLETATNAAMQQLKEKHSGLDSKALAALAWTYAYGLK